MRRTRLLLGSAMLVGALTVFAGCTHQAALQQLTPAERATFRAHRHAMSGAQARTYLSQPGAAERAAYLREIGVAQRFQALDPQDQRAVMTSSPRPGMSAEALRFLWGDPYYTQGRAGDFEQWYYLGSSMGLAQYGNSSSQAGTVVVVDLVDGRVQGWMETVPTDIDKGGGEDGTRR